MKKILKKYRKSNRDHFATKGRHIHFLRIGAFASEDIDFNVEETAHFDVCLVCRLEVIHALRNLADGAALDCDTMPKAA